jgi:uncharacterized protein YjbJ (UPF0337 family)
MLSNFKKKRIDPAVEKIEDTFGDVTDSAKEAAAGAKAKASNRGNAIAKAWRKIRHGY